MNNIDKLVKDLLSKFYKYDVRIEVLEQKPLIFEIKLKKFSSKPNQFGSRYFEAIITFFSKKPEEASEYKIINSLGTYNYLVFISQEYKSIEKNLGVINIDTLDNLESSFQTILNELIILGFIADIDEEKANQEVPTNFIPYSFENENTNQINLFQIIIIIILIWWFISIFS